MRQMLSAAAIAATILITAQPAQAQGFLKRLGDRALQKAEESAERVLADAGSGNGAAPETSGREGAAGGGGEAPPAVMTPRAVRGSGARTATPAATQAPAQANAGRYTDNLPKPANAETLRLAYNKFGEVSCRDCEGGIDFDGRPKFSYDQFSGQYEERARRAGTWAVGHVHRWQGKASTGTLTVLAEETVDGFRCKRLEYKLVRGKASADRPSLICFGLANSSSSVENWHEIY